MMFSDKSLVAITFVVAVFALGNKLTGSETKLPQTGRLSTNIEYATDGIAKTAAGQTGCDGVAQSLADATGARIVEANAALGSILLRHAAASEVHLFCADGVGEAPVLGGGSVDAISFYTRSDPPDAAYFAFIASAGAVLSGLPASEIQDLTKTCLEAASVSRLGTVYRNLGRFGFICEGGSASGRAYNVTMQYASPAKMLN